MTENHQPYPGSPTAAPGQPEPVHSEWAAPVPPAPAPPLAPSVTSTQPTVSYAQAYNPQAQNPQAYNPQAQNPQALPGDPAPPPYGHPVPPYGQAWPTAPAPAAPRRSGSAGKVIVAGLAAAAIALAGGGVGGFVGYALHPDTSPLQTTPAAPQNAAPVVDRSSLASIAAGIQPTVVSVATESGEGSGVVISADGYIVTNNHVVAGARDVKVTFNSGKQVDVDVVGTDPKTDLAVLKADATGLKFAAWGDSNAVQVGDTVLAIGSPLGLQGSVTAGIVSALHRTISVGDDNGFGQSNVPATRIGDAIQTDAPINPGNSGGALVNMNGELVGINSAIATAGSNGNIGVGFAISANKAKAVADQLIKGEPVSHPYLGVSIQNADNGGALIGQVESGSPAAEAGLQPGDVVTKVGDRGIASGDDLVGAIQTSTVGNALALTVVRNGVEQTLTATVGEQP